MGSKTLRNVILSFLLSLTLTLLLIAIYTFYLLTATILTSGPQSGGISAVSVGLSASFLNWVPFVVVLLSFIIFAFLQKSEG
jgi:hypothetical protein